MNKKNILLHLGILISTNIFGITPTVVEEKIQACNLVSLRSGALTSNKIEKVKNQLIQVQHELQLAIKNEKNHINSRELERIMGSLKCDINFTNVLNRHIQNPTQESAKKLEDLYEIAYSDYVRNALIQTGFRASRTRDNH